MHTLSDTKAHMQRETQTVQNSVPSVTFRPNSSVRKWKIWPEQIQAEFGIGDKTHRASSQACPACSNTACAGYVKAYTQQEKHRHKPDLAGDNGAETDI